MDQNFYIPRNNYAPGNPWGAAANAYGNELDRLGALQQQGYQQMAQIPNTIYDRFMQGYQQKMAEQRQQQQADLQQQQFQRQMMLAEETLRHNRSMEEQKVKDEQDRVQREKRSAAISAFGKYNARIPGMKDIVQPLMKEGGLGDIPLPDVQLKSTGIQIPGPVQPGQGPLTTMEEDRLSGLGPDAYDSEQKQMVAERLAADRAQKDREANAVALGNQKLAERKADETERHNRESEAAMWAKLNKPDKPEKLKLPPPASNKWLIENEKTLSAIDNAITEVQKNPNALGFKHLLLNDEVAKRLDPAGVTARAAVGGVSNQILHDMSGAAVTLSEDTRFRPTLPQKSDPSDVALAKLKKLREQVAGVNNNIRDVYSEANGYRPLVTGGAAGQPGAANPQTRDPLIGQKTSYPTGTRLKDGRTVTVQNGVITGVQ